MQRKKLWEGPIRAEDSRRLCERSLKGRTIDSWFAPSSQAICVRVVDFYRPVIIDIGTNVLRLNWFLIAVQCVRASSLPKKNMLEIAAQATQWVQLPSRRSALETIMDMFHEKMTSLKKDLEVCTWSRLCEFAVSTDTRIIALHIMVDEKVSSMWHVMLSSPVESTDT